MFRHLFVTALALSVSLAYAKDIDPAKPTPILPFDQVRVGMKGYGLTVFHGIAIEPFAVEVVSVMRDFAPKKGVVWVRCPDERMQLTGPVEGMSGSPGSLGMGASRGRQPSGSSGGRTRRGGRTLRFDQASATELTSRMAAITNHWIE